jgi:hypothetical protein
MKTFLLIRKISLKTLFLFVIVVTAKSIRAQSVPELAFTNPALKSGVAGQDGAVYLYNNVCPGVDAEVSVISRSGNQVVLSNIDTTAPGVGYDKAFQPVAGIPGTVPANTNWWIKFNITFYESGTSKKTKLTRFNIEGFGIDGDGNTLAEWIQVNRAAAIEMDPSTILNYSVVTNYGSEADYKVTGSTASMPVINVSETKNKAIFTYRNKDNFDFVMGAQNSSATSSEGMRTVSFLVKQFSLFSLPVKLISFSASLTNSKTELNWKTTAELNLSHFAVEKSTDGINFSAIGTVMANGSQTTEASYHFSDMVNSQETIIYYRLRSVDFDGKGEYSQYWLIQTRFQLNCVLQYRKAGSRKNCCMKLSPWPGKR